MTKRNRCFLYAMRHKTKHYKRMQKHSQKEYFCNLAIRRVLVFDTSAASLRSAAAKHTYAPQAAQQKKGAAERSRPGLTA